MKNGSAIAQVDAGVVGQARVAEESYILSLEAPDIARRIQPGQFVQMRCTQKSDPLLPRPFSIYRVRGKRILDILYEVVGRGTRLMAEAKKGDTFNIFGPLGNTFSYPGRKTLSFLVGGGVGLAPFYDLAEALVDPGRGRQRKEDVTVLLGARNRKRVFCEEDFGELGVRFEAATDDGSYGFKGLVTDLLERHLRSTKYDVRCTRIYACGPRAMLRAVSRLAETWRFPCEMSVDSHMPCGYGVCFGCAIRANTRNQEPVTSNQNYKLACVDGPVFDAKELVWD